MRATLAGLLKEIPLLSRDLVFDPALQDGLGYHLLNRRGFAAYLGG